MGNSIPCFTQRPGKAYEHSGGVFYDLAGRVESSGRKGEIVDVDRQDMAHTYKIRFSDGMVPEVDWFAEADVELCSSPFRIRIFAGKQEQLELTDLSPNETLSSLKTKINDIAKTPRSAELRLDNGVSKCMLTSADNNKSLGFLGVGEGSTITCLVRDLNTAHVFLIDASEKSLSDKGDCETWTITALIYGKPPHQLLLWAEEVVSCAGQEPQKPLLMNDGLELSSSSGTLSVAELLEDAQAAGAAAEKSLAEQLYARFSQSEQWPRILARICRKLVD
eukprot:TRINITY_DN42486_c0_g1_i1.p1 TRINITY_DN42486_c0_g1~~TRINITY_DN42486_c0_g1_i1.p1  ORF type:complete len:278 (-),score=50.11 TRINITY_DN42486_c0_g1_i1:292-1125(-)